MTKHIHSEAISQIFVSKKENNNNPWIQTFRLPNLESNFSQNNFKNRQNNIRISEFFVAFSAMTCKQRIVILPTM